MMGLNVIEIEKVLSSVVPDRKETLLTGYANMKGLLKNELKNYKFCIVIGKRLDNEVIDTIENGPSYAYLEHHNTVNTQLYQIGQRISAYLDSKKIPNIMIKPTGVTNDLKNYNPDTLTYYFSHKMAATRAGLGWIGKTDLMVTKKFGPRVRFVSILLKDEIRKNEVPIEKSVKPIVKSRCGNCSICVDICPAKAGNGREWNINTDRDSFFNAYTCMKKCRELSLNFLNISETICGICMKACPVGR